MFKSFRKAAIFLGIAFTVVMLTAFIILNVLNERKDIYYDLAVLLIMSWVIILIFYYSWAIYFYNINMGWTINDWKAHEEAKKINPDLLEDEPVQNPHHEQTLGLPPGTVRGTIAISLLVGGLAMMIASLSMNNNLEENRYFIDNFEFFKTAYLMMIAFYFGTKSLELLKDRKTVFGSDKNSKDQNKAAIGGNGQSIIPLPASSNGLNASSERIDIEQISANEDSAENNDFHNPKSVG